jgi:hypothetical protein
MHPNERTYQHYIAKALQDVLSAVKSDGQSNHGDTMRALARAQRSLIEAQKRLRLLRELENTG